MKEGVLTDLLFPLLEYQPIKCGCIEFPKISTNYKGVTL